MDSIGLGFLALLVLAAWLVLRRANELCVFVVEDGKCRLVSGRAPAPLLGQVDDIVRRAGVVRATFRIVVESGLPRFTPGSNVPDAVVQQVRNCIGQYQVAQFRQGKRAQ